MQLLTIARLLLILILILPQDGWGNFKEGKQAFTKGAFENAASHFFLASNEGSDEEKISSEYYLGLSLKKSRFYYSASKFFSRIVRKGPGKYFDKSLKEISEIHQQALLGDAQIGKLVTEKITDKSISKELEGFYFYFKGLSQFANSDYKSSDESFAKIPQLDPYYVRALFHRGVVSALSGNGDQSIQIYKDLNNRLEKDQTWLRELSSLNIARIHYENKRFQEALENYSKIPRESDNWLEAIFEASWAFFLMDKPNNALGNIHTLHSPFFDQRFFPESYVLEALTYLRSCIYDRAKISIDRFYARYSPVSEELNSLIKDGQKDTQNTYKTVELYKSKRLETFKTTWEILDALSRTDIYKQSSLAIANTNVEFLNLSQSHSSWEKSGLKNNLEEFLEKRKRLILEDASQKLLAQTVIYQTYLKDLTEQIKLVQAELLIGKVDVLKKKLNLKPVKKSGNFIGGMQPLNISQELEYWPFEGEYWEDELGSYVYNISSQCSAG